MSMLFGFVFGVYPYICLTVFLAGSLIRFDQNQYSWKSDSSQMLRRGSLRWGSNLFHAGILFLFFGHVLGLLTPHSFYGHFMEAPVKQMLAVYSGGVAGVMCFIGLSLLIHRRVFDARIRATSHPTDIAVLVILWVQLVVGLATLPFSWAHSDGSVMLILADWAQRILTLRAVDAALDLGARGAARDEDVVRLPGRDERLLEPGVEHHHRGEHEDDERHSARGERGRELARADVAHDVAEGNGHAIIRRL